MTPTPYLSGMPRAAPEIRWRCTGLAGISAFNIVMLTVLILRAPDAPSPDEGWYLGLLRSPLVALGIALAGGFGLFRFARHPGRTLMAGLGALSSSLLFIGYMAAIPQFAPVYLQGGLALTAWVMAVTFARAVSNGPLSDELKGRIGWLGALAAIAMANGSAGLSKAIYNGPLLGESWLLRVSLLMDHPPGSASWTDPVWRAVLDAPTSAVIAVVSIGAIELLGFTIPFIRRGRVALAAVLVAVHLGYGLLLGLVQWDAVALLILWAATGHRSDRDASIAWRPDPVRLRTGLVALGALGLVLWSGTVTSSQPRAPRVDASAQEATSSESAEPTPAPIISHLSVGPLRAGLPLVGQWSVGAMTSQGPVLTIQMRHSSRGTVPIIVMPNALLPTERETAFDGGDTFIVYGDTDLPYLAFGAAGDALATQIRAAAGGGSVSAWLIRTL